MDNEEGKEEVASHDNSIGSAPTHARRAPCTTRYGSQKYLFSQRVYIQHWEIATQLPREKSNLLLLLLLPVSNRELPSEGVDQPIDGACCVIGTCSFTTTTVANNQKEASYKHSDTHQNPCLLSESRKSASGTVQYHQLHHHVDRNERLGRQRPCVIAPDHRAQDHDPAELRHYERNLPRGAQRSHLSFGLRSDQQSHDKTRQHIRSLGNQQRRAQRLQGK